MKLPVETLPPVNRLSQTKQNCTPKANASITSINHSAYFTTTTMSLSSSSSSSFLNVSYPPAATASSAAASAARTLYYYNVDAILSELIRPATPKHGNLARPRLVKPEPIRPQQLIGIGTLPYSNNRHHPTNRHHHHQSGKTPAPFAVLNDRTEGARNPDPIQQQVISPFVMEEEEDDSSLTYFNGVISRSVDPYCQHSSKRSRDDEDILYYKKSHHHRSTSTDAMETTTTSGSAATLVTPNPISYYTSVSQPTNMSSLSSITNSLSLPEEPQYIVYKNVIEDAKTSVDHHHNNSVDDRNGIKNYFHHDETNSNHVWTTTPSTTVSYTIVKPIAMRPMDVIQHLDDHYYHHYPTVSSPSHQNPSDANSCNTTMTKNVLYNDVLEDGSMQVCG